MIYLGSDWHLRHKNILEYCKRPFASTDEMYADCLKYLRKTLTPNDTLIYAGDLWLKTPEEVKEFIELIPTTRIILVKGNHDKSTVEAHRKYNLFDRVCERYEFKHPNEHYYVIDHYPMLSWNHSHRGSILFHGHEHRTPANKFGPLRSMDIGYDAQQKWIISIDEATDMILTRNT